MKARIESFINENQRLLEELDLVRNQIKQTMCAECGRTKT